MAVLKASDNSEMIISCKCGCDDGLRIKIEKDEEDYCFMTFVRNDGSKALSCQAYHEATEAVRMSVFVQPGESKRTDYDSRSTWDRLLDAGSTPARSIL